MKRKIVDILKCLRCKWYDKGWCVHPEFIQPHKIMLGNGCGSFESSDKKPEAILK